MYMLEVNSEFCCVVITKSLQAILFNGRFEREMRNFGKLASNCMDTLRVQKG